MLHGTESLNNRDIMQCTKSPINDSKSGVKLFTQSGNGREVRSSMLFVSKISMPRNVNYLGVTPDKELAWHERIKIRKAKRILHQCKRACNLHNDGAIYNTLYIDDLVSKVSQSTIS